MTLSDLASIGSLVSGIAVLVSLVYLAQQTRQAALNQRAAIHQGRATFVGDFFLRMSEPMLLRPYMRALSGDPNMSAEEFTQYLNVFAALLIVWEDQFSQHQSGMLSDERFSEAILGVKAVFQIPANRAAWKVYLAQVIASDFRSFIDKTIADLDPTSPRDIFADWKVALALEVRTERRQATASDRSRPRADIGAFQRNATGRLTPPQLQVCRLAMGYQHGIGA